MSALLKHEPCNCPAYKFPHRFGGGNCSAEPGFPVCSACERGCDVERQDQGIGAYEYWGAPGVDIQWVMVSDCCGEDLIDPATGGEYEVEFDDEP